MFAFYVCVCLLHRQDSLTIEAVPDSIIGEQTWPSEMEMAVDGAEAGTAEGAGRLRRKIPGDVPSGMSTYQADWMVGDDGEWLSGDEEDEDGAAVAKSSALLLSAQEEKEYSDAFMGEDFDAADEVSTASHLPPSSDCNVKCNSFSIL